MKKLIRSRGDEAKMKILVVGPSPTRSKGGMATVIEEIEKDKKLNAGGGAPPCPTGRAA